MLSQKITVIGKVQGVGYRISTKIEALGLGITGRVKNLPDGSVEIWATGTEEQLDCFRNWCLQGPSRARVDRVEIEPMPLRVYKSFKVQ